MLGLALDEPDGTADETFESGGIPFVIGRSLAGLLERTGGVFVDWRDAPAAGFLLCAKNRREVYCQSAGLNVVQLTMP